MPEAHSSPRHLRRIIMIVVATGTLLALLFCGFWFVLPHWAPGVVIRWSPWVEPVVRAGINHRNHQDYRSDYYWERFADWGPDAFPGLSRCLRGTPDLRKAALDSYPFQAPVAMKRSLDGDLEFERVLINVTRIHDDGVVWFQVRCHDLYLAPIHVRTPGQLQSLAEILARTRRDVGQSSTGAARLSCELRMDASVPYWLAADILAVSGVNGLSSSLPPSGEQPPRIDHVWLTCGRPPASYLMEEYCLTFYQAQGLRPIHLDVSAIANGGIRISIDGKILGEVHGAQNSETRLRAVHALIEHGLPELPETAAFILRASADLPWSDAVAVADACWKQGMQSNTPAFVFGPPLP